MLSHPVDEFLLVESTGLHSRAVTTVNTHRSVKVRNIDTIGIASRASDGLNYCAVASALSRGVIVKNGSIRRVGRVRLASYHPILVLAPVSRSAHTRVQGATLVRVVSGCATVVIEVVNVRLDLHRSWSDIRHSSHLGTKYRLGKGHFATLALINCENRPDFPQTEKKTKWREIIYSVYTRSLPFYTIKCQILRSDFPPIS